MKPLLPPPDRALVAIHPAPGWWPTAHVAYGGVIQATVWGFTKSHAVRRADRLVDLTLADQSTGEPQPEAGEQR